MDEGPSIRAFRFKFVNLVYKFKAVCMGIPRAFPILGLGTGSGLRLLLETLCRKVCTVSKLMTEPKTELEPTQRSQKGHSLLAN